MTDRAIQEATPAEQAALTIELARAALTAAERRGASYDELLRLCDELISRRLRAYVDRLRTGWRPPGMIRQQMRRDAALLRAAGTTGRVG